MNDIFKTTYLFLISLIVLLTTQVYGQEQVEILSTKISEVVVYPDAALITRKGTVNLKKGSNTIIFKDIEQSLSPNTVQLLLGKEASVFSLQQMQSTFDEVQLSKESASFRKTLDSLKKKQQLLKAEQYGLQKESNFLESNVSFLLQKDELPTVDYVNTMRTSFGDRSKEIFLALENVKEELSEVNSTIQRITRVFPDLRKKKRFSNEIQASVLSTSTKSFPFVLKYLVYGARWEGDYDLYIPDGNDEKATLALNAKISQNTGVPWENVKVSLSTKTPNSSTYIPQLSPIFLGYPIEQKPQYLNRMMSKRRIDPTQELILMDGVPIQSGGVAYAVQEEQLLTQDYSITERMSIAANGKDYAVRIQNYQLDLKLRYKVFPKFDQAAYLEGAIYNWDDLGLINGNMRLYLGGNYVSNSYLSTSFVSDSITFSLGKDDRIVVNRKPLKRNVDKKLIGSSKRYEQGYKIAIRNTLSRSIKVVVKDQVPVSQIKEAKVKVERLLPSPSTIDDTNGYYTWSFNIPARKEQQIEVAYEVKAPKTVRVPREY